MEEWNFENWGIKYWSQTKEFLEYVHKEKNCCKSKNFKRVSEFIVIMKMTTLNQAVEKLKAGFLTVFYWERCLYSENVYLDNASKR